MYLTLKSTRAYWAALITGLALTLALVTPALALTGAIYTTDVACDGTNVNIFDAKEAVYLNGGPHHIGSAGLPEGDYFVKVTVPNGDLLGYTTTASVHVDATGSFVSCYHLSDILVKASDATQGYDTTTNTGGVYKVWVSPTSDFKSSKTDNFKVKEETLPPQGLNGSISGMKWEDVNADGTKDVDEGPLSGVIVDLYDVTHTTLITSTVTDGAGVYQFLDVTPGTYQVCEEVPTDWHPSFPLTTDPNCHTAVVVLENTDTANTNFGNFQLPTITVVKVVNTSHGGTAVPDDFKLMIDDTVVSSGVPVFVQPGAHTISETLLDGYTLDGFTGSCTADEFTDDRAAAIFDWQAKIDALQTAIADNPGDAGNAAKEALIADAQAEIDALQAAITGSASVAYGENITCTITNHDLPANLKVVKHVINDNGGTALADAFTMSVTGTNASPTSFPGDESGTAVTMDAGAYTANESAMFGYAKTLSAQCSGTIALGETKTCTITNDDIQPKLTVIKHIANPALTNKTAANFTMTVTGNSPSLASFPGSESGTLVMINAGAYSANEVSTLGFIKTMSADCSGTIGIGQEKTCTIMNTVPPQWCSPGFWKTALDKNRTGVLSYLAGHTSPSLNLKTAFYSLVVGFGGAPLKSGNPATVTLAKVLGSPNTYGGPAFNSVADYIASKLGWNGTQTTAALYGENCPLDAQGNFHLF